MKNRKRDVSSWILIGVGVIAVLIIFGGAAFVEKSISDIATKGRKALVASAALYGSGESIGHVDSVTPFPLITGMLRGPDIWGTQIKTEREIVVIADSLSGLTRGVEVRRVRSEHGQTICIRNKQDTKCYFERTLS